MSARTNPDKGKSVSPGCSFISRREGFPPFGTRRLAKMDEESLSEAF